MIQLLYLESRCVMYCIWIRIRLFLFSISIQESENFIPLKESCWAYVYMTEIENCMWIRQMKLDLIHFKFDYL